MTDNIIASMAGALLSLLFGYAPGLRPWFEALEPTRKALVMLVLLAVAAAVLVGAVALAHAGISMAICLLVVMLAPIVVVIGYELVGHRHAGDALDRALSGEL